MVCWPNVESFAPPLNSNVRATRDLSSAQAFRAGTLPGTARFRGDAKGEEDL